MVAFLRNTNSGLEEVSAKPLVVTRRVREDGSFSAIIPRLRFGLQFPAPFLAYASGYNDAQMPDDISARLAPKLPPGASLFLHRFQLAATDNPRRSRIVELLGIIDSMRQIGF